eukprot:GHVQ01023009.1.p1 GENE.GHVQ01023009.1~~GHVQ01023009.1.p1  ORF type:complete len:105 (-),score=1.76 GHVQ01023009.1:321-635(-)
MSNMISYSVLSYPRVCQMGNSFLSRSNVCSRSIQCMLPFTSQSTSFSSAIMERRTLSTIRSQPNAVGCSSHGFLSVDCSSYSQLPTNGSGEPANYAATNWLHFL